MASDHTINQSVTKMRGTIWAILDPGLSKRDINAMYSAFASSCAFCDELLNRLRHDGRFDRIDRGAAHVSGNMLLVCRTCCKERQPREAWTAFLLRKCPAPEIYAVRADRIRAWIASQPPPPTLSSPAVEEIRERLYQLLDAWVNACGELREEARRLRRQIPVDDTAAEGTEMPAFTLMVGKRHAVLDPGQSVPHLPKAGSPTRSNGRASLLRLAAHVHRQRHPRTMNDGEGSLCTTVHEPSTEATAAEGKGDPMATTEAQKPRTEVG